VEEKDPPSSLMKQLERVAAKALGGGGGSVDWTRKMDREVLDQLGSFRKYDGGSLCDLLRALRNKVNVFSCVAFYTWN
jgi:serine/threonine-protein kinase/endoribonuclease IRE1